MNHWISNIRFALVVTILVGIGYALSAENVHTTKHKRLKDANELEQAMNVTYLPAAPQKGR